MFKKYLIYVVSILSVLSCNAFSSDGGIVIESFKKRADCEANEINYTVLDNEINLDFIDGFEIKADELNGQITKFCILDFVVKFLNPNTILSYSYTGRVQTASNIQGLISSSNSLLGGAGGVDVLIIPENSHVDIIGPPSPGNADRKTNSFFNEITIRLRVDLTLFSVNDPNDHTSFVNDSSLAISSGKIKFKENL